MKGYGLEQVHIELLEALLDFDRVCRENEIEYSLICGTLLGAVRHKGFIPWDDDVDVVMFRSEFERFCEAYREQHGAKFVLDISQTWVPRVRKEKDAKTFVDIFILDSISENRFLASFKVFLLKALQGMMKRNVDYSGFGLVQRILLWGTGILGKFIPFYIKYNLYHRLAKGFMTGRGEQLHISNGAYALLAKTWPAEWFRSPVPCQFEGHSLKITGVADDVLSALYGTDYMQPPPEEQRIGVHLNTG